VIDADFPDDVAGRAITNRNVTDFDRTMFLSVRRDCKGFAKSAWHFN